jgi:predicted esterase
MRFQLIVILSFAMLTSLGATSARAADVNDFDDFSSTLLPGRLYVPPEAADSGTARPFILFLHGAGETGSNNVSQVNGNIDNLLAAAKERGAFLYAPQATSFSWTDSVRTTNVMATIDEILSEVPADPSHLYVTGLSMGGGGTWSFLNRYTDRFAAAVPIAGTGPGSDYNAANLVDKPIWAFHARNDSVVAKENSRNIVNSVLSAAGEPTLAFPPNSDTSTTFEFSDDTSTLNYTEWPTGGHGIWGRVYSTDEMYDWMFSQTIELVPGDGLSVTRKPYAIYRTKDNDSDGGFDDLGDVVTSSKSTVAAAVGEQDTLNGGAVVRLTAKFWLNPMPELDQHLESATLRLFLEDIVGAPAGPVSLFHSVDDNDMEELPSDFEDTSYEDTLLDLVKPTDPGQMYYEIDVTDLVRRDYASDAGNPLSAFRLQVNEAIFLEDDQGHSYRFTMPGAGANPPELVLTFIPEPSSSVLAILGMIGLFALSHRRSAA